MQVFVRFRAGKLVAGIGVILAGTLSGCWDTPKRPNGPANFPKGNLTPNAGFGQPGGNTSGFPSNTGQPVNRATGAPPFVEQSGRPAVGPLGNNNNTGNTNAGLLNPPGAGGIAQPIATNGARGGIQPIGSNLGPATGGDAAPGALAPLPDSLPLKDSMSSVPPITTQNRDPRVRFQRQAPQFPDESLNPPSSAAPASKFGTLQPPPSP